MMYVDHHLKAEGGCDRFEFFSIRRGPQSHYLITKSIEWSILIKFLSPIVCSQSHNHDPTMDIHLEISSLKLV